MSRIPALACLVLVGTSVRANGQILTLDGATSSDRLGTSLSRAGDITGDGVAEIVVGSNLRSVANTADGVAAVFDGVSGAKLWETNGNAYYAQFGTSLAAIGDVSGDGIPDFAIGAPGQRNGSNVSTGMVAVVSGAYVQNLSGLQFVWKSYGNANADQFGFSIANCGDIDGDGKSDLVVGAPGVDIPGKANVGRVTFLSGASGAVLYTYDGQVALQNAGDQLGYSVCAVSDLSGDGRIDVVVGIPYDDTNNNDAGAAHVLALGAGSATILGGVYGTGVGDEYGWAVSGGGDVDADGKGDFAVAAPLNDFAYTDAGRVYLYSGATRTFLFAVSGEQVASEFGRALSFDGDLNWDGCPDLAVGAPLFDAPCCNRGRVNVYSGRTRLLMRQFDGSGNYDNAGIAVKILGGIDTDPGAELAFSAPYWDGPGFSDVGQVLVYSSLELSAYPHCVAAPNSAGAGAHISSTGSLSLAAGSFTLVTSGCPANKTARYFYGPNATSAVVFGNGWRCVGNPFYRLPVFTTSASGDATFALDFNALPPAGPILPGVAENFQLWYRDPPAGGANYNASDALNVTFRP